MTEPKALDVKSMQSLKEKVPDVQMSGDPGAWKLLGKASSVAQGWMRSTKAMEVPGGALVQVSTLHAGNVAEALAFVPGVRLTEQGPVSSSHYVLVPL